MTPINSEIAWPPADVTGHGHVVDIDSLSELAWNRNRKYLFILSVTSAEVFVRGLSRIRISLLATF